MLLMVLVAALIQSAMPALRTVEKGDQSNFDEGKQVIVRTPGEWNALWHAHSPDRPQPRVDLSRDMIVAVFLGSRNTAGYAVTIESVQADHGTVVVRYRQTDPPRDAITAQVITSPYHIVAVPNAAGAARFERVQ
jgi:hypothetical protein